MLWQAVNDAIEAGELVGDPQRITHQLWAAGHRLTPLTLNRLELDVDAEAIYVETTEALIDRHRR